MIYNRVQETKQTLRYTNQYSGWGHQTYRFLKYISENPGCTRKEIIESLGIVSSKDSRVGARFCYNLLKLGAIETQGSKCIVGSRGIRYNAYKYKITKYGKKVLRESEGK